MEINKRLLITSIVLALIGIAIGLIASYVDSLAVVFAAVSFLVYLMIMAIGIPRHEPSSIRYYFTLFAIVSLPVAWAVFFLND